jgi:type IV secretion system protein VirB5
MKQVFGVLVALLCFGVQPAHAQFAVIDIGAITQLITEVEQLDEQINTAHEHLAQAQAAYAAITGGRGMELLLSGTVRNYLPEDWAQLVQAMNGVQGAFGVLARDVNATVERNAVLSQQALNDLAAPEREALIARRRSVAVLEALARTALANASDRFEHLQQLIDAIPRATDEKAILDLQARIGAEQGMLTNEATKLQVLYQAAQVEALTAKQRADEQAIADIGHLMDLPPMGLR